MSKQDQVPENERITPEAKSQEPSSPPEVPYSLGEALIAGTQSHDIDASMPDTQVSSDVTPIAKAMTPDADVSSEEIPDTDASSEQASSPRKRKSKDITPEEIKFRETFSSNFNYALEHPLRGRKKNQADVARKLNITKSVVSGWANATNTPSSFQLVKISEYLGRKAEWMLEDHSFSDKTPDTVPTYTDIFKNLLPMIDLKIIDKNSITDYFLRHMVARYYEIKRLKRISADDKNRWLIKLYSDYDVPIQPKLDSEGMYIALEEEYEQVDKDRTALVILGLVREYWEGNKEEINRIFAEWYNNADPKAKQELDVQATIQQMGVDAFFNALQNQ